MISCLLKSIRPHRFVSTSTLTDSDIGIRVMNIIKQFDKAEKSKIDESKKFTDFGLDSLDQVELIIELENSFKLELTDDVAEKITTPREAVIAIRQAMEARE